VTALDSYDEIPYESTPFHETHPGFLATRARLFGVDATAPEVCRVLEIGCASGGNLIPMAVQYPQSHFLGIELSAGQVAEGKQSIGQLGLRNIEIRQGDILEFAADAGAFDYIIVHGVYSWVPPTVREAILAVCRRHLSANGVAYISYNTLPGWRWRGMLRDMLLHHTRHASSPGERLQQAEDFLGNMGGALSGMDSINARYLREEIKRIHNNHPSYLYHEYLEAHNHPFLFSDFIADIRRHALDYIADVELAEMFSFSLSDTAAQWVEQYDDVVEMWQYMDFISGRNFRQSLLCHAERRNGQEMDLERFSHFAFYANLTAQKQPDLRHHSTIRFLRPDGSHYEVHHPLTQAALLYLGRRYPDSIGFDELATNARAALQQAGNIAASEELDQLQSELFSLFAHQVVQAETAPATYFNQISERPRASALVRAQHASGQNHVTVAHHLQLQLDPFSTHLLQFLDGTHTIDMLIEQMVLAMQQQPELNKLLTGQQRSSAPKLRRSVEDNCRQLLALFARNGVFEA
jgi:methyltransferase-like protein/ubiquinone/menaquinone biosynthesis C-methylase UbiE